MSLFFLTPGVMHSPAFVMRRRGGLTTTVMPTTVAVMQTAAHDVVLVDVGFSRSEIEEPERHFSLLRRQVFKVHGTGADSTVAQLARRGIAAADVTTIVATHLHADHVGGFVDFPNAQVVAPASEFASARRRGLLGGYHHTEKILRSGRARPILLNAGERFGFPRHLDLFGDGTVLVLDAKGHTAGSVAVLLTDPDSNTTALMAGDTAYTPSEFRLGEKSWLMTLVGFRDDWIRATWGRLVSFECAHPDTPVVLSHDLSCFNHLSSA